MGKRYGQLDAADVKELRALQQENGRLKNLLTERDLAIDRGTETSATAARRLPRGVLADRLDASAWTDWISR